MGFSISCNTYRGFDVRWNIDRPFTIFNHSYSFRSRFWLCFWIQHPHFFHFLGTGCSFIRMYVQSHFQLPFYFRWRFYGSICMLYRPAIRNTKKLELWTFNKDISLVNWPFILGVTGGSLVSTINISLNSLGFGIIHHMNPSVAKSVSFNRSYLPSVIHKAFSCIALGPVHIAQQF